MTYGDGWLHLSSFTCLSETVRRAGNRKTETLSLISLPARRPSGRRQHAFEQGKGTMYTPNAIQWDDVSGQLDTLATLPSGVPDCARLLGELERAKATIQCRMMIFAQGAVPSESAEERLLTVDEAAASLSLSTDYVYRNASKFPFTVKVGSNVRFSRLGIGRFIRERTGRDLQ